MAYEYVAPVVLLEQHLSLLEEETIILMQESPPRTSFGPGEKFFLKEVPRDLVAGAVDGFIPAAWEVRFVVSAKAYEAYILAQRISSAEYGASFLSDSFEDLAASHTSLNVHQQSMPIVYAHGWPHGMYPNSAAWFFGERNLRRVNLLDETQGWEPLLDEFKTPFSGYDTRESGLAITIDLAPDMYSGGLELGGPLAHEEATFHTAALLGLEERLLTPISAVALEENDIIIDPEHDIFL